jgi:hypothetical protein
MLKNQEEVEAKEVEHNQHMDAELARLQELGQKKLVATEKRKAA